LIDKSATDHPAVVENALLEPRGVHVQRLPSQDGEVKPRVGRVDERLRDLNDPPPLFVGEVVLRKSECATLPELFERLERRTTWTSLDIEAVVQDDAGV